MQIAVVVGKNLVQPVHQFDVWIAAQLAEDGGAFDRLVEQRIEFFRRARYG